MSDKCNDECSDSSSYEESEACESSWQAADSGLTSAALRAVFLWLDGAELARAGAVCRAWRVAAADDALWRRLLRPCAPAADKPVRSWRSEYVCVHARWAAAARLAAPAAGGLLHAALDAAARRLALTTDDAQVLIWEMDEDEEWHEVWRRSLLSSGWERVARAQWARVGTGGGGGGGERGRGDRLLLAGPVALAHRWELIVLQPDEWGGWCVAARSACGAGAAGGWAGAGAGAAAYLALEPRRLAPRLRFTTVYINAATQETQSEYAGVTAPLLNIFNEDDANITHFAVADVPLQDASSDSERSSDEEYDYDTTAASYAQILVAGFSGGAGAVRAWGVHAVQPPPLLASGDLRARAARSAAARAAARDHSPEPEPEMTEAEVRAMCTPPDAECHLTGTLVGLTVQNDGRCVWACESGGALSAWSLPQLAALRRLPAPPAPPAPRADPLHYVHPAAGRGYIATPEGGLSGRVWVWGARGGARRPAPLEHAAPAVAVAFPATRRVTMLVLTTAHLYCTGGPAWRRALASRSCGGSGAEPCPPCPPQPPPPCRGVPPEREHATRIVCCPPPQGNPPPCSPPCVNPPLTCADSITKGKRTGRAATCVRKKVCGLEVDRVAQRLDEVAQYRRRDYEKEVAERRGCRETFPALVPYSLGAERECCKTTDGKQVHVMKCGPPETPPCGPNRTPPPPRCVELHRDTACKVRGRGIEPCEHKPRTIVEIDRSGKGLVKQKRHIAPEQSSEKPPALCANRPQSAPPAPTKKLSTRLMESLSLTRNTGATKSCSRRSCDAKCDGQGARRAGDHTWCSNLKPLPPVPPPCRKPTRAELLKQRPSSSCGPNDPRCFHTSAALVAKSGEKKAPSAAEIKAQTEKFKKALQERESYKEAAQGRVATEIDLASNSKSNDATASLDVCIPPGSEKLNVRVLIDEGSCKKKRTCKKPPPCKEEVPVKAPNECATAVPPPGPAAAARCASVATSQHEKRESWLSIKSLLASCRKDNAHSPTCPTNAPKSPCGSPPAAPSTPCKQLPPTPPAPSPCKKSPAAPSPCKAPPPPPPCKAPPAPSPCKAPDTPSPCNKPKPPKDSPCKAYLPPKEPTKPKDSPCSSSKTKFTAEKNVYLGTFLLKV